MTQRDFPKYFVIPLVLCGICYGILLYKEKIVERKLTVDNIYRKGKEWRYRATFFDKNGSVKDSQFVVLSVTGEDFLGQTGIRYKYMEGNGKNLEWVTDSSKATSSNHLIVYHQIKGTEETGIIEDSKKVWMHPPREASFRFTELTAFPEIQKPFTKGKQWKNILQIGKGWGKWEGFEVKKYYEIVGQKDVSTSLMNFTGCWQVDTRAESKEGIHNATFYFHPKYGFVLWEYTNPDSTKVILDLEKVSGF
ncbi:MAG: hypothetical protein PHX21_00345 [bacterium]|nr:hypothetical protein [bacterium]